MTNLFTEWLRHIPSQSLSCSLTVLKLQAAMCPGHPQWVTAGEAVSARGAETRCVSFAVTAKDQEAPCCPLGAQWKHQRLLRTGWRETTPRWIKCCLPKSGLSLIKEDESVWRFRLHWAFHYTCLRDTEVPCGQHRPCHRSQLVFAPPPSCRKNGLELSTCCPRASAVESGRLVGALAFVTHHSKHTDGRDQKIMGNASKRSRITSNAKNLSSSPKYFHICNPYFSLLLLKFKSKVSPNLVGSVVQGPSKGIWHSTCVTVGHSEPPSSACPQSETWGTWHPQEMKDMVRP